MKSKPIFSLLAIFICLACLGGNASAQEFGSVKGNVLLIKKDAHGKEISEPAQFVLVHFTRKSPNYRHYQMFTGPQGEFVRQLDLGEWIVQAEEIGYKQDRDYKAYVRVQRMSSYPIVPDPPVMLFATPTPTPTPTRTTALQPLRLRLALYAVDAIEGDRHDLPNPQRNLASCEKDEVGWHGHVVVSEKKGSRGVVRARVTALGVRKDSDSLTTLGSEFTNETGEYTVCFRPVGDFSAYVISVTMNGYDDFLKLLPRGEDPPEPLTLEEITSDDEDPLMERTEASRRYVFSPRVMQSLPISGLRSFDTVALLAPGVAPPPDTPNAAGPGVSPGLGTAGQFSVNGLRSRENNFTVDGSDNNDEDIGTRREGFVFLAPQSIESLSQFQIITALGDARFGRNIGGQVDALTKSGSSDFHGSVYGFLTNNHLSARDFFDRTIDHDPSSFALRRQSDGAAVLLDGQPIVSSNPVGGENPFNRSQLGFSLSGPVKNIGSFFGSLEHVRIRASKESNFIVPTVEQRGIFDAGATGLLFEAPGNPPVPLYAASIPGDAIFSLYPFPNNPLGPFGPNTYTTVLPADADATRLSAKMDHQFGRADLSKARMPWSFFSSGDTLTGRYNLSRETSIVPVTGEALFSSLRTRVQTQNVAFYLNRQLTDRISDVIRFSVGRTRLAFFEMRDPSRLPSSFFPNEPFLLNAPLLLNVTAPLANGTLTQPSFLSASSPQGAALLASLGYTGFTQAEQAAGALGQVNIPGFSPLGVDVYHFPQSRANNTIQAGDTVTFVRQSLISNFGVDMRKIQINSTLDRNFRPLAVFDGLRSSLSQGFLFRLPGGPAFAPTVYSGTTLAAAGAPTGLFQTLATNPNSTVGIRFSQWGLFEQHDWRASSNLNINLGARVDLLTRPRTKHETVEKGFDLAELKRQGQTAIEDCVQLGGSRPNCENVANAIVAAFPSDFKTAFSGDIFDLDIRAGLAWAPNERTVVRGGAGIYSGEFPGIVLGESRNTFPDFLPLNFADVPNSTNLGVLFNPANPILRQLEGLAIAPNTLNTLPANVNGISLLTSRVVRGFGNPRPFGRSVLGVDLVLPQNLRTPYSLQYAVTLERQLGRTYGFSVAYVGTRGIKLLRVSTPDLGTNRILDAFGLKTAPQGNTPVPIFGGAFSAPQAQVPNAFLVIARTFYESSASSSYNSLQFEFRKQYSGLFQFRTALTYSHAIDDVSDFFDTSGAFALPQNSSRRSERASSNFDIRWRSVTHAIRDFPKDLFFFKQGRLGGWQLAAILTAQTGQPFTVNSAFDINRDGNLTDRLNSVVGLTQTSSVGDHSVQLSVAPGTNLFNLLAADGQDGAIGRNTFRAPSQVTFDLSVVKFLNFSDTFRVQARTEFFNLFNRANFGIPVRILESPAFGKSTYTTTPPRTIQFGIKVIF